MKQKTKLFDCIVCALNLTLTFLSFAGYKPSAGDLVTLQTRPGFNVNTYARDNGLTLVGRNFLLEAVTNGVGGN